MKTSGFLLGPVLVLLSSAWLRADGTVTVHEWGTFTCLQDEYGRPIKGINVDDEPVPRFVYTQGGVTVTDEYSAAKENFGLPPYPDYHFKGWAPGDPQVTMRLETPVIYFYQPQGQAPTSVPPMDVHVDFHGGCLSQYYPYANFESARSMMGEVGSLVLREGDLWGMTSSLTWKGVRLGSSAAPVESDDKVWTTPREVSAPLLEVAASNWNAQGNRSDEPQAEHFLFYRGVGHLDSPVRLQYGDGKVNVWSDKKQGASYAQAWLVEIHADGICAFRDVGAMKDSIDTLVPKPMAQVPQDFDTGDFNAANLAQLKASMQDALVKEGLYPDEASAMLRTWELSYFKSPGLRFFYIVPREWVDQVLPLRIGGAPTQVTRVMVGRIELISAAQKAALARLAAGPCPDLADVTMAARQALRSSKLSPQDVEAFYRGEKPLSDLGITIPPLVQDYLSLGRFRDPLIVHEQGKRPTAALAQFIEDNRLLSEQN